MKNFKNDLINIIEEDISLQINVIREERFLK